MHLELDDIRYPISNDYADDTGQSWSWDRAIPACPSCGEPLSALNRQIEARWRGGLTITCGWCDWQGEIKS
jgi:hypothetical protein